MREYRTDHIAVKWDPTRCIHSGLCLQGLPAVFDVEARPWVDLSAADADEVARVIERCPSGALRYERLDGEPGEQPDEVTTITPRANGPLAVRGNVEVRDARGELFDAGPRLALCRCGASKNQPFCDMSHVEAGFRDAPRVRRRVVESPKDLGPAAD